MTLCEVPGEGAGRHPDQQAPGVGVQSWTLVRTGSDSQQIPMFTGPVCLVKPGPISDLICVQKNQLSKNEG